MAGKVKSKVEKCSLSLKDFYDVSIIESKPKFSEEITDVDKIEDHLKTAIETMKEDELPALFRMHYNQEQDGTTRTGHCVAFLPKSCKFIDVQKDRYWLPEKDRFWKSVKKIDVWTVNKQVAEEYGKKCGVKNCEKECMFIPENSATGELK